MKYLSIGSLVSLLLLAIANVSAIAAEQCSDIFASSDLPGYAQQCSVNTNVDDSVIADASGQKSCVSDCTQVYGMCKTTRARDCHSEYETCSWIFRVGGAITTN